MFLAMAIAFSALLALGERAVRRWKENEKSFKKELQRKLLGLYSWSVLDERALESYAGHLTIFSGG
jgi:hypothetical protein